MQKENSRPQSMNEAFVAFVLLASLSYFWLFNALIGTLGDVAKSDIYFATALTTIVLIFQAGLLFLAKPAVRVVLPVLGLVNTYLLYMIFSSDIGLMRLRYQAGICVAIAVLYWVVLDIVLRAGRLQRWILVGAPVAVALFVGLSTWSAFTKDSVPNSAAPDNIRTVEFKSKPNIYFLSFDAMIPESLARKILNVAPPPYVDVLKKHGAHFIPNMFSDFVPTKFALSSVLALDPIKHRETIPRGGTGYFDSIVLGKRPNALSHILTANGYTNHFTFSTGYFGPAKGPYLKNYHVYSPYSACTLLSGHAKTYGFFGYCPLITSNFIKPYINLGGSKQGGHDREGFIDYAQGLIQSIARNKNSGPHFYMQHVLYPAHASNHFAGTAQELDAYRGSFQRRSGIAAEVMDRMLTEIRTSDPTAIIFLYGDHGTLTSRPVKFAQNKKFFVQDRHGILGALINAESCEPYLTPPEGEHFQTTARVVTGLVQCLAGGESPFIKNVDFSVLHQIDPNEKYEDYIYE